MRLTTLIHFTTVLAVVFAPRIGFAAEPTQLGYERWTATNLQSGVLFSYPAPWLFGNYTNELQLFSTGKWSPPKADKRLLDIDNVIYDKELGYPVMDVVWIENEGDFEADSWLLYGLTKDEVELLAMLPKVFILDIEKMIFSDRYAVILRDNPHGYASVVFVDSQLNETALLPNGDPVRLDDMFDNRQHWRATDLDVHTIGGEYFDWPQKYDESMTRYDVVFTTNTGQNKKNTVVTEGNSQTILDMASFGYQLVDFEDNSWKIKHYWPWKKHAMIFVEGGRPFTVWFDLAASELLAQIWGIEYFYDIAKGYDRCIDIERHPTGGTTKDAVFIQ